jgi:HNH endonuclease
MTMDLCGVPPVPVNLNRRRTGARGCVVDSHCLNCGRPLAVPESLVARGGGRGNFCSVPCRSSFKRSATATRFWRKLDRKGPVPAHVPGLGPCWLWTGHIVRGYGHFAVTPAVTVKAHRYAFEASYGLVPGGFQVCHACDNPPCCNPMHLFPGTAGANAQDREMKGRGRSNASGWRSPYCGERHHYSKLAADDVAELRRLAFSGLSGPALAIRFGISVTQANRIASGRSWRAA